MYRIDNATATAALPAPTAAGPNPDGFFTKGNPQTATPATVVDDEWANMIQEEIAHVIEDADGGNTPLSKASRTQLKEAILARIAAATAPNAPSVKTGDFTANEGANKLYAVTPAGASAVGTCVQASTVALGHSFRVMNDSDGKSVTLVPFAGDMIDGQASYRVPGRSLIEVARTGATNWSVTIKPPRMVGEVIEWASNTLPAGGWAWVNNQLLNRTTEAGLFAVWGTTYGVGDGATTFGVRDDRGRVKAGKDDMGGVTAASRLTSGASGVDGATLGAAGGVQTHTLTTNELAAHPHDQTYWNGSNNGAGGAGGSGVAVGTDDAMNQLRNSVQGVNASNGGATANAGGGAAHPNAQPTIICNFIVKL